MNLRRVVLVTHRWIGLASSVVLAVVAGTGAIIVWPGNGIVHRAAGRLHESLALGHAGTWIVLVATAGAVLLQIGGAFLWWRRKSLAVRTSAGWRSAVVDLHHSAGVLAMAFMLTLAASALAMAIAPESISSLRRLAAQVHTARAFPAPVKFLYMLGTTGFLVQGLTGVAMWWKPTRP